MKNKKKMGLLLLMIAVFALEGCGGQKDTDTANKTEEKTVATIQVVDLPEESYLTLKDGVYTATGGALQLSVPEGWVVSEEDPTLLLPGKEDETKDFVSVQVADKEEDFSKYTKESFEQYYNSIFDNYKAVSFTETTVEGLPAYCLQYEFSKDDSDITGYEYLIDGNYTYMIGFTDVSGTLKEEMDNILDSVIICK